MIIRLPFPSSALFPNAKNGKSHHASSAAKKSQREDAFYLTKQATKDYSPPDGYIPLSLLFVTPSGHKRDLDNMLAASKALIDGMAKAIGIDDSMFKPVHMDWVRGSDNQGALIAGVGVSVLKETA